MAAFATEISRQNKQYFHGSVPRFFDMETEIDTLSKRKGLKQKMGPNDLFSLLKWVVQEHWK